MVADEVMNGAETDIGTPTNDTVVFGDAVMIDAMSSQLDGVMNGAETQTQLTTVAHAASNSAKICSTGSSSNRTVRPVSSESLKLLVEKLKMAKELAFAKRTTENSKIDKRKITRGQVKKTSKQTALSTKSAAKRKSKHLAEKRQKEAERKRKQREKIKNNPEAYRIAKLKEKARRHRRKQTNGIKSVLELTSREQRKLQKTWRVNSLKYRNKRRVPLSNGSYVQSPPASCPSRDVPETVVRRSGRKIVHRSKASVYRRIVHVEAKCLKFKLIAQRYKKRCQRLINDKQKNSKSPSPRKRVRHILSSGQKVVKRKLYCLVK